MAHFLPGEVDRLTDDVEDPVGGRRHFHLALGVVDQDHELVTAEPGGEVVGPDAGADPIGDRGEHPVAAGVAQEVVHHLEPVQVEEEDGRRASRGQTDFQLSKEGPPVGQPGEVVVERNVLGAGLGVDARLELHEHGGDGLQRSELLGRPGVQSEVEEAQDAPGRLGQEERHAAPPTR